MDNEKIYSDVLLWLKAQSAENPFGELSIRIIYHQGQIARIEQGVTTKFQPERERN